MNAHYIELDPAVKLSVRKFCHLYGTQQQIVTLVTMFAQKNTPFYAKSKKIALILGKSEKTVKNALTKLYTEEYLTSFRIFRRRFLSIHPENPLYTHYEIATKYNHLCITKAHAHSLVKKHIFKDAKNNNGNKSGDVNNSVDEKSKNGTLETDDSFKYNIKNINTGNSDQSLINSYLQDGAKLKVWNPSTERLIDYIADRRKLELSDLQTEQIVYHVEKGLAKDGHFKNEYQLVNQALSLIKNGLWQNPYGFVSKSAKNELNSEKMFIEKWESQKQAEISSYRRTSDTGIGLSKVQTGLGISEVTSQDININRITIEHSSDFIHGNEIYYESGVGYGENTNYIANYTPPPPEIEKRIIINTPYVETKCKSLADIMAMTKRLTS